MGLSHMFAALIILGTLHLTKPGTEAAKLGAMKALLVSEAGSFSNPDKKPTVIHLIAWTFLSHVCLFPQAYLW